MERAETRTDPSTKPPVMYDTTVGWRYNNPKMDALYPIISLGQTAEALAEDMQISREDQDAFALESQKRAISAINDGRFRDEIVPVEVPRRRGDPLIVDTDEHPRYRRENGRYEVDTSMERLAKLRPAFQKAERLRPAIPAASTTGRRLWLSLPASGPRSWVCAHWCAGSVPQWRAWIRA